MLIVLKSPSRGSPSIGTTDVPTPTHLSLHLGSSTPDVTAATDPDVGVESCCQTSPSSDFRSVSSPITKQGLAKDSVTAVESSHYELGSYNCDVSTAVETADPMMRDHGFSPGEWYSKQLHLLYVKYGRHLMYRT